MKLKNICEITSSKRIYASEYTKYGIPFYRSKEIIELANGSTPSLELFISQEKFNEIKMKFDVPQINDILLTAVGTLGVSYLVKDDKFYFKDGNLMWFKNIKNNVLPKYLFYYFNSSIFKNNLNTISIGSTQKALTIDKVKEIEVNIPNISIQQHIVDTIGSIDGLIESTNKKIEKISEILLKLFDRLPTSTGNKFSDVFTTWNGGTFSSKDYVDKSKHKLITIKNINGNGFDSSNPTYFQYDPKYEKFRLKIGDILLTMTGAYLGRTGIVDDNNCFLNQRILKVSSISPAFTYCFLLKNKDNIFNLGKGSAQQNLGLKETNNFNVDYSLESIESFKKYDIIIEMLIKNKIEIRNLNNLKQEYLKKFFG